MNISGAQIVQHRLQYNISWYMLEYGNHAFFHVYDASHLGHLSRMMKLPDVVVAVNYISSRAYTVDPLYPPSAPITPPTVKWDRWERWLIVLDYSEKQRK